MRSCEFCRSEVPDNASFCGVCGREVGSSPQTMRGNGNSTILGQILVQKAIFVYQILQDAQPANLISFHLNLIKIRQMYLRLHIHLALL